jgi:hypothetical protein
MRLPTLPPAWWVRNARKAKPAHPKGGRKAKAKGRPSIKFALVLRLLGDIKPPPGLAPAEIEKKVLAVFRPLWAKLKPDDKAEPPVSRRTIFRAYQKYLKARSRK